MNGWLATIDTAGTAVAATPSTLNSTNVLTIFDDVYSKDYFSETELEIYSNDNVNISIGEKRNLLLDVAKGKYIAFIDDDDSITEHYFKEIRKGTNLPK